MRSPGTPASQIAGGDTVMHSPNHDRSRAEFRGRPLLALAFSLGCSLGQPVPAFGSSARTVLGPETLGYRPLEKPVALSAAPDGSLVLMDLGTHQLIRISAAGDIRWRAGSRGREPGKFEEPSDLAVDAGGSVYVLDRGNLRFQKFDANGEFVWAKECRGPDGVLFLNRLCPHPDGGLLATGAESDRVHHFDSEGNWQSAWDVPSTRPAPSRQGPAISADSQRGRFGLTDPDSARVLLFDSTGSPLAAWALPLDREGRARAVVDLDFGDDGSCAVLVREPRAAVVVFDSVGVVTHSWELLGVGSGNRGPSAIAIAGRSEVFVADPANQRLRAYDPDGMQADEAERYAAYAEWDDSRQVSLLGGGLVPIFSSESATSGFVWAFETAWRGTPSGTVELSLYGSHPENGSPQSVVGNPYLGIRLAPPNSHWGFRFGTQIPIASDEKVAATNVAFFTDVERRPAFFPKGFLIRPEVEFAPELGGDWSVALAGAGSLIFGMSGREERWLEYKGEARYRARRARAQAGWAGRWAPQEGFGPGESRPLGDLQNQIFLRSDFLSGALRPGFEVRWWVEDLNREEVAIVLGAFLEFAFGMD